MAKKLCADMIGTYEHLSSTVKHRREYAKSWTDFISSVQRMTLTQIPELKDGFAELASLIEQFTQIHTTLANKEERTAEDLRDVYERFEIVFRAGEEVGRRRAAYVESNKALQILESRIKVEETRPNYEKIKYKFEKELAIAKTNKADALRRLKHALTAAIEHKGLYNKFKIRRLSHGWHLYAAALKEAAEQELDAFDKIRNHLATLNSAIEGSPEAAQVLESAPTTPSPAPVALEVIANASQNLPEPEIAPKVPEPEPVTSVASGWTQPEPVTSVASGWTQPEPVTSVASGWTQPEPVASGWSEPEPFATGWSEPEPVATGWSQPEPVATGWTEPETSGANWGESSSTTGSSVLDNPTPATPSVDTGNPFDDF